MLPSLSAKDRGSADEGWRNSPIIDLAFANSSLDGRKGQFSKLTKEILDGLPKFLGRGFWLKKLDSKGTKRSLIRFPTRGIGLPAL